MSSLTLKNNTILTQKKIKKKGDHKAKFITYAPEFIHTLPEGVKSLATASSVNQVVFCPDGTNYLTRYLTSEERTILNAYIDKNEPLPDKFLIDSVTRDFKNIYRIGSVPIIRVNHEGYIFCANVLNRFFEQLENLVQKGDSAGFELKDLLDRPDNKANYRDSIFSVISNLARIFVNATFVILSGFDSTTHTLTTRLEWYELPNAEKNEEVDIKARIRVIDIPEEGLILKKKLILQLDDIKHVYLRCLALISALSGKNVIEGNLDHVGYCYVVKLSELIKEFKNLTNDEFVENAKRYTKTIPSLFGLYRYPIRNPVVSIKLCDGMPLHPKDNVMIAPAGPID